MKVELHKIKIRDVADGFVDSDTEGVKGYGGRLDIRPKYQRNFVYKDKQRDAVIHSIRAGFPLSIMYWVRKGSGTDEDPYRYEVLDGQQRTISFCQYINKGFPINEKGNFRFFHNLTQEEKDAFLDYELMVYICEGSEAEELEWFQVINIASEPLSNQELRNAIYSGTWLTSAKEYFSKPNSGGKKIGDKYLTADWNRQGGLEVALKWVSHEDIIGYMSEHAGTEEDGTPLYENADDLYNKFEEIIKWVKRVFPNYRKEMKKVDWGYLYDQYGSKFQKKDADRLEKLISKYMADEDITKKPGIYGYVLGEPEKVLSIRKFNDRQKREAYERQEGKCPRCQAEGNEQVYDIGEMEADHITPWSQGGATVSENCMMLCKDHNNTKSDAKGKGGKKAVKEEEKTEQPIDPLASSTPLDVKEYNTN